MAFERITIDHAKMGGLSCIRGLRIPGEHGAGSVGRWAYRG